MRRAPSFALLAFAGVVTLASCGGCRHLPLVNPKGPMNEQQANAVVHDPYPQADIGPSDAAARPPGYEQPLPEAERVRLIPDAMPWLGR